MGIAFRVSDWDRVGCDVQVSGYLSERESYRYSRRLEGGGFLATGAGGKAWVEASLPKRVGADNVEGLPLPDAVDALYALYEEARQFVRLERGTDDDPMFAEVVRLDLVRDFDGVEGVGGVLDGLAAVEQPGRVKVRRFADPSRGQAQTLRVGPKAWGCTLYDKHAETGGLAAPGRVRFETRLHRDQLSSEWAKAHGGKVVHAFALDERPEDMATLSRAWFDRAGFGRAVGSSSGLAEKLVGLEARTAGMLWAYLTLPGFAGDLSAPTRRRYRRLAESLGVAPAFFGEGDTVRRVRLDYVSGRLRAA